MPKMNVGDLLAAIARNAGKADEGFDDEAYEATGKEVSSWKPKIGYEALIERLRDAARHAAQENPFKPGDLVTPREDATLKGKGAPAVVVKTDNDAEPVTGEPFTAQHKVKFDVLTCWLIGDYIEYFWQPHHMLRHWTEEDAEKYRRHNG